MTETTQGTRDMAAPNQPWMCPAQFLDTLTFFMTHSIRTKGPPSMCTPTH